MSKPNELKCNLCGYVVDPKEFYCTQCGEDLDFQPEEEDADN